MCSTYFLKSSLGQSLKTCRQILHEISFQTKLKYVNIAKSPRESWNRNSMRKQHIQIPVELNRRSRIDVLKISSNFYHLFVSMRELFSETVIFIAQFILTLWFFKYLEVIWNFHFTIFFHSQGLLISSSLYC